MAFISLSIFIAASLLLALFYVVFFYPSTAYFSPLLRYPLMLTPTLQSALFKASLAGLMLLFIGYGIFSHFWLRRYLRSDEGGRIEKEQSLLDLHPEAASKEEALDDTTLNLPEEFLTTFLSSIKVFGYLDRTVFHELAKHLGERRLVANELLFDQSTTTDRSFYVVVEGAVQVRIPRSRSGQSLPFPAKDQIDEDDNHSNDDDIDKDNKEFLLTEVGPGGTVSSLFNIIELFTENAKNNPNRKVSKGDLEAEHGSRSLFPRLLSTISTADSVKAPSLPSQSAPSTRRATNIAATVTATATMPTTLLVIPETAFLELRLKFPQAAAHLVQVILTRFQRTTFLTLHKYLGLTRVLLNLERNINQLIGGNLEEFDVKSLLSEDDAKPLYDESQSIAELAADMTRSRREKIQLRLLKIFGSLLGFQATDLNPDPKNSGSPNSETSDPAHSEQRRQLFDLIQLQYFEKGAILVKQGDRNVGMYFIVQGELEVSSYKNPELMIMQSHDNPQLAVTRQFAVKAGSIVGAVPAFIGNPSLTTITASSDTLVGYLSKIQLDYLASLHPSITLGLAGKLVGQLSPLVRAVDMALDWVHLNAGAVLCRKGEPTETVYIVLHGRLRSISEEEQAPSSSSIFRSSTVGKTVSLFEIVGEYGPGDSIGELEMLANSTRPGTIHAVRDSELAAMPRSLFHILAMHHPEITLTITLMIAKRAQRIQRAGEHGASIETPFNAIGSSLSSKNLKTVAILPIDNHRGPVIDFAERLRDELCQLESCLLLESETVVEVLGKHAFSAIGKLKLLEWLAEQEELYRIVIYLADSVRSPWTRRCIRQADCILLVGVVDQDPSIGAYEQLLLTMKTSARKELVLLHQDRHCTVGITQTWLKDRIWVLDHHHVVMPIISGLGRYKPKKRGGFMNQLKDQIKDQVLGTYHLVRPPSPSALAVTHTRHFVSSDYRRLAKRLLGKSIGLVLGGGGARGLAHLGVIRAMEEAGITFDLVGGTSIGAFIGGLYARDLEHWAITSRARVFASRLASKWRQAFDLTYPITSWFTGHAFNRSLWKIFADRVIEDLWLPYFCITTNITHSRQQIHRSGRLWRYIRASMSLSGFLPPLCTRGGEMLLDGGYVNNLPVDVMIHHLGAERVVAIDVGAEDDTSPVHYGDTVSGWWVLLNRLFGRSLQIPTLADIQSRLAYVSCVSKLEEARQMTACHYLRPPVQTYATLEFGKFEEIVQTGYEYGLKVVDGWRADGTLELLLENTSYDKSICAHRNRRNSV